MTLYDEGSNASSTNKERDLSQSSGERRKLILQNERGLRRSEESAMLISDPLGEGAMLALPRASSEEQRNQPSE